MPPPEGMPFIHTPSLKLAVPVFRACVDTIIFPFYRHAVFQTVSITIRLHDARDARASVSTVFIRELDGDGMCFLLFLVVFVSGTRLLTLSTRPPRVPSQQPPVLNNHHRTQNHTHPLNHPLSAASASGGMMWDLRGSVPVPPQPPSLPPSLPPSADSGGTTNGLMPTHPSIDMLPSSWGSVTGPDGQPIIQTSPPGLYEASTGSMDTTSPNLAGNLPPTRSSSRLYDIKQSPNLHNYLEPTFGAGDESQHRAVPFGPQDQIYLGPIDTGLLSETEARLLFNQYVVAGAPFGAIISLC